tara:strand:- start:360 stop:515 length:156 start_codon:yes stop_codon:yes gene_type:complete
LPNKKRKDINEVIDTVRSRARDDENSSMLGENVKKRGRKGQRDTSRNRFNE